MQEIFKGASRLWLVNPPMSAWTICQTNRQGKKMDSSSQRVIDQHTAILAGPMLSGGTIELVADGSCFLDTPIDWSCHQRFMKNEELLRILLR